MSPTVGQRDASNVMNMKSLAAVGSMNNNNNALLQKSLPNTARVGKCSSSTAQKPSTASGVTKRSTNMYQNMTLVSNIDDQQQQ